MEAASQNSISGDGHFREADATDNRGPRGEAGGARAWCGRIQARQTLHAAAAPFLRADRAAASIPLRHGGWPHPQAVVRRGTHAHGFSSAAAPSYVARSTNGRNSLATLGSGSAG